MVERESGAINEVCGEQLRSSSLIGHYSPTDCSPRYAVTQELLIDTNDYCFATDPSARKVDVYLSVICLQSNSPRGSHMVHAVGCFNHPFLKFLDLCRVIRVGVSS